MITKEQYTQGQTPFAQEEVDIIVQGLTNNLEKGKKSFYHKLSGKTPLNTIIAMVEKEVGKAGWSLNVTFNKAEQDGPRYNPENHEYKVS